MHQVVSDKEGRLNTVVNAAIAAGGQVHVKPQPAASAAQQVISVDDTLCSPFRLEVVLKYAFLACHLDGELWELGVYKGGSATILGHYAAMAGKKVRLFDSFAGLPEPCALDVPEGGMTQFGEVVMHKGEWTNTDVELVRQRMPKGCDYEIHQGFVPDTLAGLEDCRVGFAHLDLDLYEGTKAALQFLYPRMVPNGVIVCDDYNYPRNPGVMLAVRQTLPENFRIWSEADQQAVLKRNVEYAATVEVPKNGDHA
jgi:hypothetical protein